MNFFFQREDILEDNIASQNVVITMKQDQIWQGHEKWQIRLVINSTRDGGHFEFDLS